MCKGEELRSKMMNFMGFLFPVSYRRGKRERVERRRTDHQEDSFQMV